MSTLQDKINELDALSPGCIAYTYSTSDGAPNYNISFYYPNINVSRIISDHSEEISAISKMQEYINYLQGGNSPVIPHSVTARQMRVALVLSGISISTIDLVLNSLSEPTKSVAKITWEYSNEFHRNNQLLLSMAPALGLTEVQVDDLFKLAATL